MSKHDKKLFVDDNISEISYELPTSAEIPLHLLISDDDLRIGKQAYVVKHVVRCHPN